MRPPPMVGNPARFRWPGGALNEQDPFPSVHPDRGCALFLYPAKGVIVMALPGPAQRGARLGHSAHADWTDVADVPFAAGEQRELPKLSGRRKWNDLVVRWWAIVRTMPHCVLWTEADWIFAEETALMKHDYFADDDKKTTLATEIRRREDIMGTTIEARRKLRIRYIDSSDAGEPAGDAGVQDAVVEDQAEAGTGLGTVTPLASRRGRLTKSA